MLTLILLLASLFGSTLAPSIQPHGPLLHTRARATSQGPLRPIGPQTETLDTDGTVCLDPDGRVVPCRPQVP